MGELIVRVRSSNPRTAKIFSVNFNEELNQKVNNNNNNSNKNYNNNSSNSLVFGCGPQTKMSHTLLFGVFEKGVSKGK